MVNESRPHMAVLVGPNGRAYGFGPFTTMKEADTFIAGLLPEGPDDPPTGFTAGMPVLIWGPEAAGLVAQLAQPRKARRPPLKRRRAS